MLFLPITNKGNAGDFVVASSLTRTNNIERSDNRKPPRKMQTNVYSSVDLTTHLDTKLLLLGAIDQITAHLLQDADIATG